MITFRKLNGFTMIELTAALAVLGLIALFGIPKIEEEWAERIVNHAASQVHDVLTASRRHRLDTQSWPSNIGDLTSNGYLTTTMATPPLGGSYTFNQVGDNFELRFNASQSIYANRLLARLPYARRIGVADVATRIPIPGHEVSYAALDEKYYHRDGSRELTGTLAGGDQDAVNLRNIEMTMLTDRDDITKVLDPSDLSVINNLTANEIDANYVETGALNLTRLARENYRCDLDTDGNIAVDEFDNKRLLFCVSDRWSGKQGAHTYHGVGARSIYASSNGIANWPITRPIPDLAGVTYSALQIKIICNTFDDSESNTISIDGSPVHTSYAYDAQIITSTVVVIEKVSPSSQLSIKGGGGMKRACEEGLYIELLGYWGV